MTDARTGLYVAQRETANALDVVARRDPDRADRGFDDARTLLAGALSAQAHAYQLLGQAGLLLDTDDRRPGPRLPWTVSGSWPRHRPGRHSDDERTW
ncbi:hypothetical protein [Actinocatenispora comari]|uniref:hypothetical protein n=1 Tax=Actinocatenispora comari TaxID=2807577 RepID=UPI001A91CDF4|nr:hypothetical protein [Actinocatenispora comari]